jgi:hypothetical protein
VKKEVEVPWVKDCVGGTLNDCINKHAPFGITVQRKSSCTGGVLSTVGMGGAIVNKQCKEPDTWVPKGAYLGVIVGGAGETRAKKAVKKSTKKAGKKTVKKSTKKTRRR